jgi:8-oxo-dGTP diphosphatase
MKKTTLCYIENDGCWLMMYRDRKPGDMNEGKWLGAGGKIEAGETADECNAREVLEETGLKLRSAHFYGIIRFRADQYEDEDMYLYSSDDFEPADEEACRIFRETGRYAPPACREGRLEWIPKNEVPGLSLWEGDRVFIERMLDGSKEISMTLSYTGDSCTVIEE